MPLVSIDIIGNECKVGLWKIEEDEDTLYALRPLSPSEKADIITLKNNKKRRQRLAYRVLLKQMLQRDFSLSYGENGKPYLEKEDIHLSVSHSGDYATVILSTTDKVGIDIEKISERMPALASHFLSPTEMQTIDIQNIELLHMYWGTKECLYKMYSEMQPLFSEHLSLKAFDSQHDSQTTAYIQINDFHAEHTIFFRKIENYMLVVGC